jgi:hypothetical protein
MEKDTTSATAMPFYADERGYHEKDEGYADDAVVVRPIGTYSGVLFPLKRALNLSIR